MAFTSHSPERCALRTTAAALPSSGILDWPSFMVTIMFRFGP
jgi:hypothetical protein